MSILILPSNFVRRNLALSAALVLFAGASVSVMNGQTSQASSEIAEQRIAASAQAQGLNQEVGAIGEVRSSSSTSSSLSSNPSEDTVAANVEPFNFANAMQYNGRPRYGRPRYRGGNTNPDGSSKWIFYGGAGLAQPAGNTWKYFTPSWGLQIGGGLWIPMPRTTASMRMAIPGHSRSIHGIRSSIPQAKALARMCWPMLGSITR